MHASLDHAPTAVAAESSTTERFDLYRNIHKALRAAMCDTLVTIGRTDASDAREIATTLAGVRRLLSMCLSHVDKENRYVHPAIEARSPGSSALVGREHDEHLQAIADLGEDVEVVDAASAESRDAAMTRLYHHLSSFVAENFEHMLVEETAHNAALWAHYSDAELHAIEGRILASIAPPEMMDVLRWMAPSIPADARARMFGGMREDMPAPMFANVLAFAKSTLSTRDVEKLDRALG